MSLVKPSVSKKIGKYAESPDLISPNPRFPLFPETHLISPNRLIPVSDLLPRGVFMSLVKLSVSQKKREIRRMPRHYFPKSQFSIVSRNPDLIIPNSLFPVIRDHHGASWFRSRNELFCCAAGAKKIGIFTTKKGGNA